VCILGKEGKKTQHYGSHKASALVLKYCVMGDHTIDLSLLILASVVPSIFSFYELNCLTSYIS
jgi:hypothetical protein